MGACEFWYKASGKSAKEAFRSAVEDARYKCGNGGYTGTIAEKSSYKIIPVPDGVDPENYADELLANDDRRISDKWGPAGCVRLSEGEFLFFGYASS